MKHLEAMKLELMCCTGCGCCKQTCPTLDIGGTEVDSGRGRIFLSYGLLTEEIAEDDSVIEALQRCPLCGRCEQDCPSNIPIRDIIRTARSDLERLLPAHAEIASHIAEFGNPYGLKAVEMSQNDTGDIAYFAGCVSTYEVPELRKAAQSVFKKLDIDVVTIDEVCCGSPLERMGQYHQQYVSLAEKFSTAGVSTIITGCPSGLAALAPLADRFALHHLTEFLTNQNLPVCNMDATIMYHDSSVLGRALGRYEAPRRILDKVGGFLECSEHHHLAKCCGGDLAFRAAFPDMADEMARQLIDEATENNAILVTADPHCYRHLKDHGEVMDIVQVVDHCL